MNAGQIRRYDGTRPAAIWVVLGEYTIVSGRNTVGIFKDSGFDEAKYMFTSIILIY
jgi:hypothetical protein